MTSSDIAYLYSLTNEYRSIRYDLGNMRVLAAALGNPQRSFRSVLIAGTNGKGSVAKLLSSMMPTAGFYTSPHLVRLNERICIGDREISDDDLKDVFEKVKAASATARNLLYPPTYFEIVTAMAFLYFQGRVDFAVLEVGLGGRLDATNIVEQEVSVITSIGMDHQEFLGNTIEAIAAEKAGIIKVREPVVAGPSADLPPVREKAGARLIRAGDLDFGRYPDLRPRLLGRHQMENVAVAICAAECLGIARADIVHGVNSATWPGRLERIGRFLLDGAHNADGARALARFLGEFHPEGVWIIFGVMADKQYQEMIAALKPHARQFVFTQPHNSRSKDPVDLQALVPGSQARSDPGDAISYAKSHAPEGSTILICGSLYLIGEARSMLH
ncbi:MAG TPA: folylpolyglutamate synthase/dihydrofolate synthase family protein [Terriglobia bacterium]